uniref:Transposase (Putative), gypsy type n=1 Tax=Tanacetum cinerariifolium TaxID=118510 RepID=A0A6L2NBS5_TANCI|nr:hypothetical protein [Tanacetum cinerariifolium]
MVGNIIDIVTFVLTQSVLNSHCSLFNILTELRPELPDRNATIKDSLAGKIGMYTRLVKFANFPIPLSNFFLCVLEYYQINLAQLSIISATKDPLPVDDVVDFPCVDLLNENRILIRKYLKNFFCIVGLSCSYTETDARPTFLYNDDEEMGLLDFVKFADPFKVKISERTFADNEVPLLEETEDMVISPSAQPISLVRTEGVKISKPVPTFTGKSTASLRRLELQSGLEGTKSGFVTHLSKEFVSSSITPTLEPDVPEDSCSTSDVNELEAEVVTLSEEITSLNKQNVELLGKVSTLELVHKELSNQVSRLGVGYESLKGEIAGEAKLRKEFTFLQDAAARRFEEQSAKLVTRIADVRRDMDAYLYPHMLTVIAGQRWVLGHCIRLVMMKYTQSFECRSALGKVITIAINKGIQQGLEAGVEHGKTSRSLAQVEAYNPGEENKYVAAVSDFGNVSFSLLEELEALKDSPLALIMSALTLEGGADSTPKLCELQLSLDQVTVPVYSKSSGSRGSSSIIHEMLFLDAILAIRERVMKRGLIPSSSTTKGGFASVVTI